MFPELEIELSPEAVNLIERYRAMPQTIARAVADGLDEAIHGTDGVLDTIKVQRLTGQGPFPVEDHRLGVRSGQLRQSVYGTPAVISGDNVSASVGSPVFYAKIHEEGAVYSRRSKPGKVRLRLDRHGNLVRQDRFPSLAVFAGKRHKLAKEVAYEGGKEFQVHVPARAPFGFGLADSASLISRKVSEKIVERLDPNP